MSASQVQTQGFTGFQPAISGGGVAAAGARVRASLSAAATVLAELDVYEVIEGVTLVAVGGTATALMMTVFGV
jgi:hypothetical protein